MKSKPHNKTIWVSVTAVCLVYACISGPLPAQTTTQTETRSGTVVYVSGNDLVVKRDDGVVKHFVVPDSTTIEVDGRQLTVHDLKPGMRLSRTITTTTKSEDVTTIKIVKGKVWMINAPYLIVTLENGQNKRFKAPDGMKFYVDGQNVSVFHLKKGMNLTATILTTTPETEVSTNSSVTGSAPAVAEAPKPETPPLQGALLIEEPAAPAATVASNEPPAAAPEPEAKPKKLPKTASSAPLFGLIGLLALSAGLMLRVRRLSR